MTSSCCPFGVGTHVVGPLPDFWASKKPVGLGNGIFWTHGHSCIGTHAVGPLQDWNRPFLQKKRRFWSRNVNYHRFFGLFLTSDGKS